MAPLHHLLSLVLLLALNHVRARSSQISDLKSKISGVEELLEEFREQLQQDEASRTAVAADTCARGFSAVRERIIRTKASIERGATFLLAPGSVHTWRDCVHACCSQPHCTVAVVQEEVQQEEEVQRRRSGDSLSCYLFNCTYRGSSVCSFSPQEGFSTYHRAPNSTRGRPGLPEEDETQGGRQHLLPLQESS